MERRNMTTVTLKELEASHQLLVEMLHGVGASIIRDAELTREQLHDIPFLDKKLSELIEHPNAHENIVTILKTIVALAATDAAVTAEKRAAIRRN